MPPRYVALFAAPIAWACVAAAAHAQAADSLIDAPAEWGWLMLGLVPLGLALARLTSERASLSAGLQALRARQGEALATALQLKEATTLVPLLAGNGPIVRALSQRFGRALETANGLAAELETLEREARRWRLGSARVGLRGYEARLAGFETELASLRVAMRTLSDDSHECARCLSEVRAFHAELEGLVAGGGNGWDADVREGLERLHGKIDAAEAERDAGDPVGALGRCRAINRELLSLKGRLEARQSSLVWLETVGEEAGRLARTARRMAEEGFGALPAIDPEALRAEAQQAVRALARGELDRAAALQTALREVLKRLHEQTVGREERHAANQRELAALGAEVRHLEVQLHAVQDGGARQRYPRRLWEGTARFEEELRQAMDELKGSIGQAARQNGMALQRFDDARRTLKHVRRTVQDLRAAIAKCQDLWLMLPAQERRLRDRLIGLVGEVSAIHVRAASLGVTPSPSLEALMEEAQAILSERPVALDEAERAMSAAEGVLAGFERRIDSLSERLGRPVSPRAGQAEVWIGRADEPTKR